MSDLHVHASDPSLDEVAAELEALGEPLTQEERALIEGDPSDWLDSSADMALTAGLVEAAHGPGLSELGRRRAWTAVVEHGPAQRRTQEPASAGSGRSSWVLGLLALAAAVAAVAILVARPPAGSGTPVASSETAGDSAGEAVDPAELEALAGAARDGLLVLGLQEGDEGRRARDAARDYAARLAETEGQG